MQRMGREKPLQYTVNQRKSNVKKCKMMQRDAKICPISAPRKKPPGRTEGL